MNMGLTASPPGQAGIEEAARRARGAAPESPSPALAERGSNTAKIEGAGRYRAGNTVQMGAEAAEGAGRAAGQAAEEAAEGLGKRLLRGAGGLARGARGLAGNILKVLGTAEFAVATGVVDVGLWGYATNELNNADVEEWNAQKTTKAMLDDIKDKLKENKDKLLPRPDGSRWDPNNPDDMIFLINDVTNNLNNGKRPLEGIYLDSVEVPADQAANLTAALQETRRLVTKARGLVGQINEAEAQAERFDAEARSKIADAVARAAANGPNYIAMLNAPGMADRATAQTESVKSSLVKWGDIGKAVREAAAKAASALGAARGIALAAADQAEVLRDRAKSLISEAEPPLASAEQQIADLLRLASQLRATRGQLDGLGGTGRGWMSAGADIAGAKQTISGCQKEAESASWSARGARQPIAGLLTQLRETIAGAKAAARALEPFRMNPDASAVLADVDSLSAEAGRMNDPLDTEFRTQFGWAFAIVDPVLSTLESLEKPLAGVNFPDLAATADSALASFDAMKGGIEGTAAQARSDLAEARRLLGAPAGTTTAQNTAAAPPSPADLVGAGPSNTATAATTPAKSKKVKLDNVITQPEQQARNTLQGQDPKRQVNLKPAPFRPKSKKEGKTVWSQDPLGPAEVDEGTPVTIHVFSAYDAVPSIVGLYKKDAEALVRAYGLEPAWEGMEDCSKPEGNDWVYRQSPAADSPLPPNKKVLYWAYVYMGKSASKTPGGTGGDASRQPAIKPLDDGKPGGAFLGMWRGRFVMEKYVIIRNGKTEPAPEPKRDDREIEMKFARLPDGNICLYHGKAGWLYGDAVHLDWGNAYGQKQTEPAVHITLEPRNIIVQAVRDRGKDVTCSSSVAITITDDGALAFRYEETLRKENGDGYTIIYTAMLTRAQDEK